MSMCGCMISGLANAFGINIFENLNFLLDKSNKTLCKTFGLLPNFAIYDGMEVKKLHYVLSRRSDFSCLFHKLSFTRGSSGKYMVLSLSVLHGCSIASQIKKLR